MVLAVEVQIEIGRVGNALRRRRNDRELVFTVGRKEQVGSCTPLFSLLLGQKCGRDQGQVPGVLFILQAV